MMASSVTIDRLNDNNTTDTSGEGLAANDTRDQVVLRQLALFFSNHTQLLRQMLDQLGWPIC